MISKFCLKPALFLLLIAAPLHAEVASDFADFPWGAGRDETRHQLSIRPGLSILRENPEKMEFRGGTWISTPVLQWTVLFSNERLSEGRIFLATPGGGELFDSLRETLEKSLGKGAVDANAGHVEVQWDLKENGGRPPENITLWLDQRTKQVMARYRTVTPVSAVVAVLPAPRTLPLPTLPNLTPPPPVNPPEPKAQPSREPVKPKASTDPSAGELIKTYRNSLVVVSGDNGAGSGFICDQGGNTFVMTNAHVAAGVKTAGFKTIDGNKIDAGQPSVAVGHDIFRFASPPIAKPFEAMANVDENASIGDEIIVAGNSEGAGVVNALPGKIVGIGPNLVEVDAPFVPGNSGSPIIHLKSGKVIAVATYLMVRKFDPTTKQPIQDPVIRRFGYRIDSVKSWQQVSWPVFRAQAAEMEHIETLTEDLIKFLRDLGENRRITPGMHSNPAIKGPIDNWTKSLQIKMNPKDLAAADANFMSYIKNACNSDVTLARQHMTVDYFQRALADQQKDRKAISDVLEEIITIFRRHQ